MSSNLINATVKNRNLLNTFRRTKKSKKEVSSYFKVIQKKRGVSKNLAIHIFQIHGFKPFSRLTYDELKDSPAGIRLIQYMQDHSYAFDEKLKLSTRENVKKMIKMGTRKGVAHSFNLPVRGQRTKKFVTRKKFSYGSTESH
mmetsp:Transcript_2368/g.3439  ORF Transcript_2368/g.3439 Transcript_2368/m.3439 type:complete len:142 (+) Transcript_2368:79-504(+)